MKKSPHFLCYSDLEEAMGISPASPEAYYAEVAWNAALESMAAFVRSEPQRGLLTVEMGLEILATDTVLGE